MSNSQATFSSKTYLSPEQKQLAQDSFDTAVKPLRTEFNDQFNNRVNDLSQRGVLFGGLGNDLMARTLKDQAEIEGNIASNIGVNLGKTALDQAWQSNEAAKSREFSASENTANRGLQDLLSQRSIQSQQSLQERSLTNAAEQAALDRTQQLSLQKEGFSQQNQLFDRQQQVQNNSRALELALSGNLSGASVQNVVDQTFGKGFILKPEGQVSLESAAQAAGLSVDEFNKVRRAMAQGQIDDIFKDTRQYLTRDEVLKYNALNPNNKYDINSGTNSSTIASRDFGSPLGNSFKEGRPADNSSNVAEGSANFGGQEVWVNKNYGKPFLDAQGNQTINPDYIDSPDKSRQFYQNLAQIYTQGQISAAAKSGGKVICTELYAQGYLPHYIYMADVSYGMAWINPQAIKGYHLWAKPIVKIMQKSRFITHIVRPFGIAWAYHMAYLMGVEEKDNFLGKSLHTLGIPVCFFLGGCIRGYQNA